MHNSFILQQYACYTTILNMFRAARCSSSGGPIVSPQPLVSSPSVNSRTVCRWRADSLLIVEVSQSHSETPHSVGILWMNNRPGLETSPWRHTTFRQYRRDSNPQSQQASGRRPKP